MNLRGAFICFVSCHITLSLRKSVFIELYSLCCLSQAYGVELQWDSLKFHKDALKKNCRNPVDTRICFNVCKMSTRRRLTLVNTRSYDDILDVCCVPKILSPSCFFINVWYPLFCFRQSQFISFWCIYCLYYLQLLWW